MNPFNPILERVSAPQLTGPDVTPEQLDILIQAALRAPDHGRLKPSRYLAVQGEARKDLGRLFLKATPDWQQLPQEKQQKIVNMPMRAPLMLVAICAINDHPKVPREELLLSTGAGVQNILNVSWIMGLGAIWRTGELAYNKQVMQGLGLADNEEVVGFIYIGHVNCKLKAATVHNSADFLTEWQLKTE